MASETSGPLPEPWEWNTTTDPRAAKWADLIDARTALPTAWPKERFEELQREIQARRRELRDQERPEAEVEALFVEEREQMTRLLSEGPHAGVVGAFEGSMYQAHGYYRPQANCMMFTRSQEFCRVCRRALEKVIDLYSRPAP